MFTDDVVVGVVDLETNILNDTVGSMKASPHHPLNQIVLGKMRTVGEKPDMHFYIRDKARHVDNLRHVEDFFSRINVLVGQNIKFDLLYLKKTYNEVYTQWVRDGGQVWDTQVVEYLLSGQSHTYASLDQLSAAYGGTLKDDKIKEYWNNGIDTADIPLEELTEYLEHDVDNTALVFESQVPIANSLGMFPLILAQMDALLALVEIEHNGMAYNRDAAATESFSLMKEYNTGEIEILKEMGAVLPDDMILSPSISSTQLSLYLYGGFVKCKHKVNVLDADGVPVRYKSGLKKGGIRTKNEEYLKEIKGLGIPPPGVAGKSGYFSTDDHTLTKLAKQYEHKYKSMMPTSAGATTTPRGIPYHILLTAITKHRQLGKDISTYYTGLMKLVFPDELIHPNYNQAASITGRLTSSNPNGQNISGDKNG